MNSPDKAAVLAHYTFAAAMAKQEAADPALTWVTVDSKILGGSVECGVEIDDPETEHYQFGSLPPVIYLMAVKVGGIDWQQHLSMTTLDALQDEAEAALKKAGVL